MARRRGVPRKPGRKMEVYEYEDGTKWEIRYQASSDESKAFFCIDEDCSVYGSNPTEVRRELKKWLDQNRAIEWEPIIEVEIGRGVISRGPMGFGFERMFRGEKADGRVIYRKWDLTKEQLKRVMDDSDLSDADILELGAVGRQGHADIGSSSIVPYTPERWTTLRTLLRALEEIEGRLREFVRGGRDSYIVDGIGKLDQRSEVLLSNLDRIYGQIASALEGAKEGTLLSPPETLTVVLDTGPIRKKGKK